MNKAIELLDQIIPTLSAAGATDFTKGILITAETCSIGEDEYSIGVDEYTKSGKELPAPKKSSVELPLNISSFPKILDTKFFSGVRSIEMLSATQRFMDKVEVVSVQMGPDIYLNENVTLYSISVLPHFFYQYSQSVAKTGVEILPSFVSENTMKPMKRLMVTIDLEEVQDELAKIVGAEFTDELPTLERELNDVKEKKEQMVRLQQYEEGARLRDREKHIMSLIEAAKAKKAEPLADKLERVRIRTQGSLIETTAREFSEKLSRAMVEPAYSDVEEYAPIIFRMTPDSFRHAKTLREQESLDYRTRLKTDYLVPKSYLVQCSMP
jgi:hypothetical protein